MERKGETRTKDQWRKKKFGERGEGGLCRIFPHPDDHYTYMMGEEGASNAGLSRRAAEYVPWTTAM